MQSWVPKALVSFGVLLTLTAFVVPWGGISIERGDGDAGIDILPWGFKENLMGLSISRPWLGDHVEDELGPAANMARIAFLGYLLTIGVAVMAAVLAFRSSPSCDDAAFVSGAAGILLITSGAFLIVGSYQAWAGETILDDVTVGDALEWWAGMYIALLAASSFIAGSATFMIEDRASHQARFDATARTSPPRPSGSAWDAPVSEHVTCPSCQSSVPVFAGAWPQCERCGYGHQGDTPPMASRPSE